MVSLNSIEHLSPPPDSSQEDGLENNDHGSSGVLSESDVSAGLQDDSNNWASDEMCERIRSLIAENVELRGKLEKSHNVMKEQVEMISVWNEQISESDENYKSKIEECLKRNQHLEEENEELKKKIEFKNKEESLQSCSNVHVMSTSNEQLNESDEKHKLIIDECLKKNQELQSEIIELKKIQGKNKKDDQEVYPSQSHSNDDSLLTVVADDESDYAIIVQEDFLSLNSCTNAELKKILEQCEMLQNRISSINAELAEEKLKTKNLGTILEQKEEELGNLRQKQDDLTIQSTQSLSMVTCREEENKVLSQVLKETQDKMIKILEDLKRKQEELNDVQVILHDKELELKMLQEKNDEMSIKSTESMSVLSMYDEEKNNLLSTIRHLQCKVDEKTSEIQMKQKEFGTCICDKEAESQQLKNQCMKKTQQISELTAENAKLLNQVKELQFSHSKFDSLHLENQSMKLNAEQLELRNCELAREIRNLQLNLKNAVEEFEKLRLQRQLDKSQLLAAETNFANLSSDYESLKEYLNSQNQSGKLQSCYKPSLSASEIADLQNKVDELTAKLIQADDERNEAMQTSEQLQRELKMLCENSDQIPLLTAQVEEYKRELNTEKLFRNEAEKNYVTALQEIEQLNKTVKLPGRKHRKSHRSNQPQEQSSFQTAGGEENSDSSPEREKLFACPMCELSFKDTNAVENHVQIHFENNEMY